MTSRNELLTALRDAREGWLPLTGKVFTITLDPEERDMLIEALSALPEALRSEMHRCLGFAFEMKGGVRTWPVWLCSMETVKEAVAKGWLSDSQLELLIPRMGMSQVVYRLTDEGGAEFMRHHYSVPSPLRQKMTSGKTVRPIEEGDPFSTPGTYEPNPGRKE